MSEGPAIGLGLEERLGRLRHLGAERHLRDVDVAVHVRQQAQVLLADRLAGGGELGGGAERRRLRLLAAGVRVHLGVEHEHVDVAAVREHVVEPAVADVVGPSVAADEPHALLHEVVGQRLQPARLCGLNRGELLPERLDPLALLRDARLARLVRVEERGDQRVADLRREPLQELRARRRRGRRAPSGIRTRTPRCPRRASSTRPAPGRPGSWCTAWWAGCRRRSTSSRSRWR